MAFTVPVTNIGFDLLVGIAGTQPTTSAGSIKSAPSIEYTRNTAKFNPINGDGFAQIIPLFYEGQAATFEIYMGDGTGYTTVETAFLSDSGAVSIALKYPTVGTLKNHWYNGVISKLKKSDGTEPEAAYFSFEFTPSGAPQEFTVV